MQFAMQKYGVQADRIANKCSSGDSAERFGELERLFGWTMVFSFSFVCWFV